jgi:hypothetical protein
MLSAEREAKLNAIGFAWKVCRNGIRWETGFEQLREYKKANGDCHVSRCYSQNIRLEVWVALQRHKKKIAQLSEEREAKLNSIGFAWNIKCFDADWNVGFQQLLEYKEAFGDCDVPRGFSPCPQLWQWVQTQRHKNKAKTLTRERWKILKSIRLDGGSNQGF